MSKRIVLVHSISDIAMKQSMIVSYIKIMKFLGYEFVSLDEIIDSNLKGRYISLVADDGYLSILRNLMPILKKYNIPCTLFVTSDLLGLSANNQDLINNSCYPDENMMTEMDLREWESNGFEIGYHTANHLDLSKNDINEITKNFESGLKSLRNMGFKINKFAYPFGRLPKDRITFENIMKNNNIDFAYTLWPSKISQYNNFYIPRICLGDHSLLLWNVVKSIGCVDKILQNKCEPEQAI